MKLSQEIHPAFLFIPILMYFSSYLYATADQRRLQNAEEQQRQEVCLDKSTGVNVAEFAFERGFNYNVPLGCIEKEGLPEGIENFAQLRIYSNNQVERWEKAQQEKKAIQPPQHKQQQVQKSNETLANARQNFRTEIQEKSESNTELPLPPFELFHTKIYQSGILKLPAFVTPDPADGKKHPAIVWITGGESNTLGNFWQTGGDSNDQSASSYREAGMIMMFPTLRGGNRNMGNIEYNYGEVNDVIAAAEYLATLPYVDQHQIYLGGHSTGGTLALLTSEVVSQTTPALFKGVISFGATPYTLANLSTGKEQRLRAPEKWLKDILIPTWVIEGNDEPSNVDSLRPMCAKSNNPNLHCIFVADHNHFDILTPVNQRIAAQIVIGKEVHIDANEF